MQIGQFRDQDQKYSSEKNVKLVAKKYNLNQKTMIELYQTLPVVSKEKFNALQKILIILISLLNYIYDIINVILCNGGASSVEYYFKQE